MLGRTRRNRIFHAAFVRSKDEILLRFDCCPTAALLISVTPGPRLHLGHKVNLLNCQESWVSHERPDINHALLVFWLMLQIAQEQREFLSHLLPHRVGAEIRHNYLGCGHFSSSWHHEKENHGSPKVVLRFAFISLFRACVCDR